MKGKETKRKAIIIGAGYSGLSCACTLAQKGYQVTVLEKNPQLGGRATVWNQQGFKFDLGPSWYWMPEVFEDFFAKFGKSVKDYYELKRLDPPYKVFFAGTEEVNVPDKVKDLQAMFEKTEPGAGARLQEFLKQAQYKYEIGMQDYVWRPSLSITEFMAPHHIAKVLGLQMLTSHRNHVKQFFKHPTLVKLMEWPVLFLGGSPENVPALYSMMDYAAIALGTFYPEGGMSSPAQAMVKLAKELGVTFHTETAVTKVLVDPLTKKATGVKTEELGTLLADVVVASADYHHVEQHLLDPEFRTYDEKYWDSRVLSPGSLLYFLGVNKRLKNLEHHNLFFDEELDDHCKEIYDNPAWPKKPLFYVSLTSVTDNHVAPEGMENVFILVPLAPGLEDTDELRERCYHQVMDRLEKRTNQKIRDHVIVKRSFAHRDFESAYNSYKGNAYGLANTLMQTAFLKPRIKPTKVQNLYFAGQLTSPGPGVPPAIISGQVVAKLIEDEEKGKHDKGGLLTFLLSPWAVIWFALVSAILSLVWTVA